MMAAIVLKEILDTLQAQRSALQMPYGVLARRAGLSLSTVQRAMNGDLGRIETLLSLAAALGVRLGVMSRASPARLRNEQAANQARRLARFAQGNSAMEGQGVDEGTVREVGDRIKERLLGGPARRLWGE
jgi:transcriptional regulator with XRE-family HTH domain